MGFMILSSSSSCDVLLVVGRTSTVTVEYTVSSTQTVLTSGSLSRIALPGRIGFMKLVSSTCRQGVVTVVQECRDVLLVVGSASTVTVTVTVSSTQPVLTDGLSAAMKRGTLRSTGGAVTVVRTVCVEDGEMSVDRACVPEGMLGASRPRARPKFQILSMIRDSETVYCGKGIHCMKRKEEVIR